MAQAHISGVRAVALALAAGGTIGLASGAPCGPMTEGPAPDAAAVSPLPSFDRRVEIRANTYTKSNQTDPALGVDASGNLLVVWGSRRQEGGNWGIFAQRFDALGRPLGTEAHVNERTAGAQWRPDVAVAPDGSAWAVWESMPPGDLDGDVVARRFGPGLAPLSGDVTVNQRLSGFHGTPTIATDPEGRALVCWVASENARRTILARLLGPDGAPVGDEFEVAAAAEHNDSNPSVAYHGRSGFIIAWSRADHTGTPAGIFVRTVDASGAFAGPEALVASGRFVEPSIGSNGAGRAVVAWMSDAGGGAYGVMAALVEADGGIGEPRVVAAALPTEDGWLNGAAVAVEASGRFAIAYNAFDSFLPPPAPDDPEGGQRPTRPCSVMARLFDASGAFEGDAFRINQFDNGTQSLTPARAARRLVWGDQGQLAAAWTGRTDEKERSGVALTLLAPISLDAPEPPAVEPLAAVVEMSDDDLAPPERNPEPPGRPDADKAIAGEDFGFQAWSATEWVPPDPDLAVGPNHVVTVVNMALRIHDKQGNLLFTQDLRGNNGFFGVGAGTFMFDPVAFFDPHSNRYIVGCAEYDNKEGLWVAVSDDDNPMGAWKTYYHNTIAKGGFPDFENMGMDEKIIYFANDHFGNGTNWVTAFDKKALMEGKDPLVGTIKTNNSTISLGAIKNYDKGTKIQYFVSSYSGQSTKLRIEAVKDPLGAISRTSFLLTVPGFGNPFDVPQKGTATKIWAIDHRIKNGVQRDGYLYIAHGVVPAGYNRTLVRWYQIDPRGWPDSGQDPVLVQYGNIDLGGNIYTWFPDVTVDKNGTMGVTYARCSSDEYPSVGRAWRYKDDPPGTLREHAIMVASTTPDQGGRWGDYFGIENDPANPGTFWAHGEYRTDNWRTWVGRFSAPSLCYPDYNSDGVLDLFDFLAFMNSFNNAEPKADCTGEGLHDIFDFLCFVNAFNDGC